MTDTEENNGLDPSQKQEAFKTMLNCICDNSCIGIHKMKIYEKPHGMSEQLVGQIPY